MPVFDEIVDQMEEIVVAKPAQIVGRRPVEFVWDIPPIEAAIPALPPMPIVVEEPDQGWAPGFMPDEIVKSDPSLSDRLNILIKIFKENGKEPPIELSEAIEFINNHFDEEGYRQSWDDGYEAGVRDANMLRADDREDDQVELDEDL